LITQLQFTGDESVGSSSNKIKLNFNHPVKELIWVVQPDQNVDYCSSLLCDATLFKVLGAQPFNYTDAIDALPNAIHAFGGPDATAGSNAFIDARGLFQDAGALDASIPDGFTGYWHGGVNNNAYNETNFGGSAVPLNPAVDNAAALAALGLTTSDFGGKGHNEGSSVSDAGTFVLSETSLDMHCWGQTLLLLPSYNLTDKIVSPSVKVHTSHGYNHTKYTPAVLMRVLTCTHLLFAQKNINQVAHATSPELITLLFN